MPELVKSVPVQILAIQNEHAHAVKMPQGKVLVSAEYMKYMRSISARGNDVERYLADMHGVVVEVSNLLPIKLTKEQLEGANENFKNNSSEV